MQSRETERLQALHELEILDTDVDSGFDRITKLLETLLEMPIVLISFVDANRQWFKSCIGIDVRETSREVSFCSDAIEAGTTELYIVNDALEHPKYKHNPLVVDDPNIRFYAGRPIFSSDAHALGTVCVIDRKPRKLNEEQRLLLDICADLVEGEIKKLHYSNKLKHREKNLQTVSHELINTLSPIISLTELMLYQTRKYPNELINDLEMIHVSGCNALDLSKNLLDAYKLDVQKMEIHKKPINLSHFLSHYESETVHVDAPDMGVVMLDKQRIHQVIDNLLSNALDFADRITVRARINGDSVEIAVQDNGIGIADDKVECLFQQFAATANVSVKRRSKPRTGLGLYISKGLVALHGGKIWYEKNSSAGSTFVFTLPIE